MARLINADDIKYTDMLAPMGNGNYEHVGIVTESDIDAMPTVEAIPIEWMLKWNDAPLTDESKKIGSTVKSKENGRTVNWNIVKWMILEWRKGNG